MFLLCTREAAAQDYKAAKLSEAPPSELSAAVRGVMASSGIRVTGPGGMTWDIWTRKAVPSKSGAAQALGIAYPQLSEGTLVGVLRLSAAVKDYRRQQIKPGVYTLRYGLTPQNGNHMGVAPQRDFLLASPASADKEPATITQDQTITLSTGATGSKHASVWSLGTAEDNPKSLPGVFHQDEGDLWLVEFSLPMEGGAPVTVALVVVGSAPEA
jgi:hypothetical protein